MSHRFSHRGSTVRGCGVKPASQLVFMRLCGDSMDFPISWGSEGEWRHEPRRAAREAVTQEDLVV